MSRLTFPELRAANLSRNSQRGWMEITAWSLADWLIAAGGECGEALNIVKKLNRERDGLTGNRETHAELLQKLADELADAVIYADLLAARFGVAIDDRSFDAFRKSSVDELLQLRIAPQTTSAAGTAVLVAIGQLAGVVADVDDGQRPEVKPAWAIGRLVRQLDILALMHDIDLGAAVAAKFNATSRRLGFPERLVA